MCVCEAYVFVATKPKQTEPNQIEPTKLPYALLLLASDQIQ